MPAFVLIKMKYVYHNVFIFVTFIFLATVKEKCNQVIGTDTMETHGKVMGMAMSKAMVSPWLGYNKE